MNKKIVIERLSLIKYILQKGVSQSEESDPICSFAILHLHDAIEMLFLLVCKKYSIKTERKNFLDYFAEIDKELKKNGLDGLQYKNDLKLLNEIRRDLKHKGKLASKHQIQETATIARLFIIHCSITCLEVDFDSVSLISLLSNKKVAKFLKESEKTFKTNNLLSKEKLSRAYNQLIKDYQENKSMDFIEPFEMDSSLSFISSSDVGRDFREFTAIGDFIDGAKTVMMNLQRVTQVLAFGFDYKKYVRFRNLIPDVWWSGRNKDTNESEYSYHDNGKNISQQDFDFCFTFIIESALKLQEFDYQVE